MFGIVSVNFIHWESKGDIFIHSLACAYYIFMDNRSVHLLIGTIRKFPVPKQQPKQKKATIRLLRTIVVLSQSLHSLPDEVMMTMKLLYYDDGMNFNTMTNFRNATNASLVTVIVSVSTVLKT